MSAILTDQEVAALDHALQSVAMPENFRAMVDRIFESHFALTEKVANPLQAAALAALVARREKKRQRKWKEYIAAERQLETTADALLAAEGGTG